jgi:hypothetical protein
VIRTWTVLVLLATGLATQAADAAVIQGTRPPSRADRKGLVRAFDALHRNRSHLRLVGFRVWENKPAGAAYSLTTDAQGKYVAGHTDLFRRLSGHRWKHTSHFKNENPLFNWASTLHPGYLYRATSDGTGAYDEQSTSSYDIGHDRRPPARRLPLALRHRPRPRVSTEPRQLLLRAGAHRHAVLHAHRLRPLPPRRHVDATRVAQLPEPAGAR